MPVYIGGTTAPQRSAAHSWHHMLRTCFRDAPHELRRSAEARHAIRRLAHRKGLR